jgi:hypothetical protein
VFAVAENMHKIKLLKLYEFLRRETDENHPISRAELCRKLNEMGISSNVRTLCPDIKVLQENYGSISSNLKAAVNYGRRPLLVYARREAIPAFFRRNT